MIDFEKILGLIERNYLKNRTIVSKDIPSILDDIEKTSGLPMTRHRYKTGEEYGTWIVPQQWDVKEAWIRNAKGETLASYQTHPLFVAPYSAAVEGSFTKAELLPHLFTEPKHPEAFAYNHRLAFDPKIHLKDWCLSLPHALVQSLDAGPFHVRIKTEVEPSEMLIGEVYLKGESEETIVFVSDYCHPGQVNDSFSGIVLFLEVMQTLATFKNRHYTYCWLLLPETIGSSVYLASRSQKSKKIIGGVFADNVGSGGKWFLKSTRSGITRMDLLATALGRQFAELSLSPFMSLIGNDEHVFDSPQAGIPCLALQKYPFEEYHTSLDCPERLQQEDLQQGHAILVAMVELLEKDRLFQFVHNVPFCMSRYDLYADYYRDHARFMRNRAIMNHLDGKRTLLEIAVAADLPFAEVEDYVHRMHQHDLVRDLGRKK